MDCAIIHDSSHVTVALFSDVILCMQYFCAGFTYMRVNLYILCVSGAIWLSREELCCSEMMQLLVIVLAMNEISLII